MEHASQDARSQHRQHQPRFPTWVEAIVTPALLMLLTTLYVVSLHLAMDVTRDELNDTNVRDGVYFGIHGAWAFAAMLAGIAVGAWFRRSMFGLGALFVCWMVAAMVAAQIVTFQLACEGYNEIIRHWNC